MKKTLLLSAAAVCALSLSAQEQVAAMSELVKQEMQLNAAAEAATVEKAGTVAPAELVKLVDGSMRLVRTAKSSAVAKADASADPHFEIYPYYYYPSYLFMYGYTVNTAPFDTDLTYYSGVRGLGINYPNTEAGTAQRQKDWAELVKTFTYKFSYVDSELKDTTSAERKITVNYEPYPNLSLILPSPTLQVLDSVYTSENDLVLMGKSYLNTSSQGLTIVPLSTMDFNIIGQLGLCALSYSGAGKMTSGQTFSEYGSSWLTRYVKAAIPEYADQIASVNGVGFSEDFEKPLVPMALSSYSFRIHRESSAAGASFKVTFYKQVADAEGKLTKGEKMFEKTFTESAAIPEEASAFYTVPFTSKNAFGETLSYAMIEDAMVMEITDINGYDFFSPLYGKYSYDNMVAIGSTPTLANVLTTCTMANGTTIDFAPVSVDAYALGSDEKGYYYSYAMQGYMDAEYPILSAVAIAPEGATSWADVASPKQVDMKVSSATSQSVIQFCCSAAKDGEIQVEMADGDFLPDWLMAEPKVYLQKSSSGNGYVQFANVSFGIDNDELKGVNPADWKGNVVVSYKNQKVLVKVNGGTSGVNNIVDDAIDADIVSSEYFDLQGRKLNAEPENGIFIQKSLLSNGKTVATKVAK